eukprot:CFRG0965T1
MGDCIYYKQWNRTKDAAMSQDEEFKLMYGMLYSIKSFAKRLSPQPGKEALRFFKTNQYKLHFYEAPTGLKLILITSADAGDMDSTLRSLYSQIYVEYAVKNPKYTPSSEITSELFAAKLDQFIRSQAIF